MKRYPLPLMISLCAVASATHAETIKTNLAPGLWEETRVTLVNGKNVDEARQKHMEKIMANLTPEQRKEMQNAMGSRGKGGTVLTCLTAAQVAKGIDTDAIKRKMENSSQGCTMEILSASATGGKFKGVCAGPQGATYNGAGEFKISSDKEWSFKMVADGKVAGPNGAALPQAANFQASQEVHARWKSSNCGDVMPMDDRGMARGEN
jgi:hypothetical protein